MSSTTRPDDDKLNFNCKIEDWSTEQIGYFRKLARSVSGPGELAKRCGMTPGTCINALRTYEIPLSMNHHLMEKAQDGFDSEGADLMDRIDGITARRNLERQKQAQRIMAMSREYEERKRRDTAAEAERHRIKHRNKIYAALKQSINPHAIVAASAEFYEIPVADIYSRRRQPHKVRARHAAWKACKRFCSGWTEQRMCYELNADFDAFRHACRKPDDKFEPFFKHLREIVSRETMDRSSSRASRLSDSGGGVVSTCAGVAKKPSCKLEARVTEQGEAHAPQNSNSHDGGSLSPNMPLSS